MKFWRFVNALNFDVVVGAVVSMFLAAHVFKLTLPSFIYIALAIAVWVFYTADHLFDIVGDLVAKSNLRREFHLEFRTWLIVLLAILAPVLVCMVYIWLDRTVFYGGLVLALVTGFYLLSVWLAREHSWVFPKELAVAVLYIAGTWGPVMLIASKENWSNELFILVAYLFLVIAEGMIVANYDTALDEEEGHPSFVRWLGSKWSAVTIVSMLCGGVLLMLCSSLLYDSSDIWLLIIYVFMAGVLGVVHSKRSLFAESDMHRLVGEIVFVFPVVLIFNCC